MAKWIYERWDYGWEDYLKSVWDSYPKLGTYTGSWNDKYLLIDKDGEIRATTTTNLRDLEIGAIAYAGSNVATAKQDYEQKTFLWLTPLKKKLTHNPYSVETLKDNDPDFPQDQFQTARDFIVYHIRPTVLIDTIVAEETAYPQDGISGDFWYKRIKPAFPTMRILRDGQWAEVETGFVLKDGVWKPIEEIYKLQDGQWVQA